MAGFQMGEIVFILFLMRMPVHVHQMWGLLFLFWWREDLYSRDGPVFFKLLRSPGIDSARCSLTDRYDIPILTRFLAPIDWSKIPAQIWDEMVPNFMENLYALFWTKKPG
jgi:hypothetical protein